MNSTGLFSGKLLPWLVFLLVLEVVFGLGDVCLQTNMGMQLLLKGVKHAPDVRFNLIFVQVLDDVGYNNHFGSGK